MRKIPFNLGWQRTLGSRWDRRDAVSVDLPDDYIIQLPRKKENPGGGMVGFFPSENAEYTHALELPSDFRGTLLLYLDGAYEKKEIYVDHHLAHYHPYGYTGDFCDLSRWITGKKQNIRITTSCQHPASRWYTGGGLYRGAVLYEAGKVFIHPWDVFVTSYPEGSGAVIDARVRITNRGSDTQGTVTAQISEQENGPTLAKEKQTCLLTTDPTELRFQLKLKDAKLWDTEAPHLYCFTVSVQTDDCRDSHSVPFGVRLIEIDAENGFRLNGKAMKLRGGCIHHDNGFLGAAAFPRSEERKIALLKQAGFNAIRTAHNPPSTALLDACDRLGMLVLDESFDCWRVGKTPMDYHREFEKWWDYDTASMVRRDRNHPCVFCYSIGNEIMEFDGASDGILWGKRQADLVRSLDPTRLVTSGINMACGRPEDHFEGMDYQQLAYDMAHTTGVYNGEDRWGQATEGNIANLNIAGYNYMYNRYASDRLKYPGRVIMGTETMPFYAYENTKAVQENPHVIGDFVWVAMDYLGEAGMGGVVWAQEPPKRMPFEGWPWISSYQGDLDMTGWRRPINYYRNVVWGLDRGIHLFTRHPEHAHDNFYGSGWHWEYVLPTWTYPDTWLGKDTAVVAYADCDEVLFLLNGKTAARVKPVHCMARALIPYEKGILKAVAVKNGEEIAVDTLETAGIPYGLRLSTDRAQLHADGMDVAYIRAEVVDAEGHICFDASHEITVSVCGEGRLLGIGSGNPKTDENFGTGVRKPFEGSVTAAIRSSDKKGEITATFVTNGVRSAQITIKCE